MWINPKIDLHLVSVLRRRRDHNSLEGKRRGDRIVQVQRRTQIHRQNLWVLLDIVFRLNSKKSLAIMQLYPWTIDLNGDLAETAVPGFVFRVVAQRVIR